MIYNILEDIRFTMEVPDPRLNQRRFAQVRFLGESYNFKMIDSNVIFSTLYSLITFAVPVIRSKSYNYHCHYLSI